MLPEYINPYTCIRKDARMADKSFVLVSTPKDFGQYLQNKRKRKKK